MTLGALMFRLSCSGLGFSDAISLNPNPDIGRRRS